MGASRSEPAGGSSGAARGGGIEHPIGTPGGNALFGSDVVADTLRALGVPYVALTPGASYRGLHDSLVNHLGNERPQMLLCLHEEHAVAVAHGYAKVTGEPLAVALHSNVGLMHATMAVFNAWCDRMPALLIGATGPVDAPKRRPWIDWIHTARDQGSLLRHYVKWDDQPASPAAAREALLRAAWLARTAPKAPVYVNLDAEMQEAALPDPLPPIEVARFLPEAAPAAPAEVVARAAAALSAARAPVILMGRMSRDAEAWAARVALAEGLGARVVTDLKVGAAFPTEHPLHAGAPGTSLGDEAIRAVRAADAILSLDWVDLAGTLLAARGHVAPAVTVIQASLDHQLHNGWSMDHQALPAVDHFLAAAPEAAVTALLAHLPRRSDARVAAHEPVAEPAGDVAGRIALDAMGRALRAATGTRPVSLLHLPLSWNGAVWPFAHPLDFIGGNGGAGVGAGPGLSVGAALALRGTGRLPVGIVGDGDFLMGVTALWTAVHYRIPLLLVVANNRSLFNDEMHQERVARRRGRAVENRWIGQRIDDPAIDLAQMARAQGAVGWGPVVDPRELRRVFDAAIAAVEGGAVAVVDVHVEPGERPARPAGPAIGSGL